MMASRRLVRLPVPGTWPIALLVVLLAALAVRLYGIDWDEGADLHPDELFIAKIVLIDRIRFDWPPNLNFLLDPARSGLNPRSADPASGQFREFAYGALPLWVTDAVAFILSRLTGPNWNAAERAYLVGRALSALLSALTILPIAALGTIVAGRKTGLLAAVFAALAPMSIQLAHFFTTDSWLTFFVALCLLACVIAAKDGSPRSFATAGAMFGLAMATKGSVFALSIPIAAALVFQLSQRTDGWLSQSAMRAVAARGAAALTAATVAFVVFEPFALLRPDVYLFSLTRQAEIASGTYDAPFTRVYAGTMPVVYQVEQLLRWGYGPVAGVLALAGIALIARAAIGPGSAAAIILSSWVVAYGIVLVLPEVKFLRYLEPLAPVLAVAAALALVRLSTWLRRAQLRRLASAVPATVVILTAAWTAAFLSIYAHENTRLAATHWIYSEIPPGSKLTAEYWDDALPRSLGFGLSPAAFGFGTVMLDPYRDLPPEEASDALYEGIRSADYIVQSSLRVESAIRAAPWRYPIQGRFFDQLQRGVLGFAPVAAFARPPAIGRQAFDDRDADESFVNYDHPQVTIYQQTGPIPRADYDAAMAWALQRPWYPAREPPQPTLLLDTPVAENPSVADARWSAGLTSATPAALIVWVVLLVGLLAAGLPIARFVLPHFADAGWGLARTLALVVAAYPVWLGASLELFRFRALWVICALAGLGLAGWWLRSRQRPPPSPARLTTSGRAWIHAEAAFWIVFMLFLTLRLLNPDGWHPIWGGEKAMELAQINAIGRSAFFPPYDPWYADGYVNYYYYGFYLIAFMLKATGIPAEIGFNLALPTMMAMLAAGGFSVAASLAKRLTRSPQLALLGGWGGAVALTVLGNLSAIPAAFDTGSARFDPFLHWTWAGSRAIDDVITEFPFFSGLYADLHAHVIALPLTVATVALCLATASARARDTGFALDRATVSVRFVVRLALLALLLGTLSATNAWDVPVYAALAAASLIMATARIASWAQRGVVLAVSALALAAGAWLLFLPFHRHFVALFGSLALVRDPTDPLQFLSHVGGLLAICALGLTVLLLPPGGNSAVLPWLSTALLAAAVGILLLTRDGARWTSLLGALLLTAALAAPPAIAAWNACLRTRTAGSWSSWLPRILLALAAIATVFVVASGRTVFGLLLALGVTASVGWLRLGLVAEKLACVLVAAGCLTAAGVEIVVVADDLIGGPAYRMNTVFKFYNQVWVLLSLSAASLLALMVRQALRRSRLHGIAPIVPVREAWSRFGLVLSGLIVLSSLAYPVLATAPRLAQRFTPGTPTGTLDALAWMVRGTVLSTGLDGQAEITFAGDADAIAWLLANVSGSPVIAEASIGPYRCNGSRISVATGLPTIIGWERHQQQQRYPETLPARVSDVRTLYTSPDVAAKVEILRRYNVAYVVVGDLERRYPLADNDCTATGSQEGIAAFAEMVGTTLEVAFSSRGTTLYRVLPLVAV